MKRVLELIEFRYVTDELCVAAYEGVDVGRGSDVEDAMLEAYLKLESFFTVVDERAAVN